MNKLLVVGVMIVSLMETSAMAKVFHSRQGAFKLAFPGADRVERKHLYLKGAQVQAIQRICQCPVTTKLLTVYVGHKGGSIMGYAYIDTHRVRTLPETFMVVLDPAGKIKGIHILAFSEPPEYLPPPRWLGQFTGIRANGAAQGRIAGIAGATLSANAVTRATRRILSVHRVLGLSSLHAMKTRATMTPSSARVPSRTESAD